MHMVKKIKKISTPVVVFLETLFILTYVFLEELVWERLAKPITKVLSSMLKEKAMIVVSKSNKYVILSLFSLMFGVAEFLGIFAGFVAVKGYIIIAAILYMAKVVFAGVAFWFLGVAKEKLFSIIAFKKSYDFVMRIKSYIENTEIYQSVKRKIKNFKEKVKEKISAMKKSGKASKIYMKIKEIFATADRHEKEE